MIVKHLTQTRQQLTASFAAIPDTEVGRLKIRSAILIVVFLSAFLLAVTNYTSIPQRYHIPVFVGLAIALSLIVLSLDLGQRVSKVRFLIAIVNMGLVTTVYLSYLEQEVVIASLIITAVASIFTYYRVVREYRRGRTG